MSSLTSPALVFAADKAIIASRKALAKVSDFTCDFSADAIQPGETMKVAIFNGGKATEFNASTNNYETKSGTVTQAEVKFAHHVKSTFEFTDTDFLIANGTHFWANAGRAAGESVSAAILAAVVATVKTSTTTVSDGFKIPNGGITKATIAKLRKECADKEMDPAKTVLALNPTHFADMLALLDANVYGGAEAIRNGRVEGLYGFKSIIEVDGLDHGALIHQDAIAVAGRVRKVQSPKVYEEVGTQTDEISGLVLGIRRHGSAATGTNFLTVEALFGAALVQADKCLLLGQTATAAA